MTRRIALTILVCACAMLIAGGLAAYMTVRQTLLSEMDGAMIERAMAVLREASADVDETASLQPLVPPGDRYLVRSGRGQTIARPAADVSAPDRPAVVSRGFVVAGEGVRMRTMTLRWDKSAARTEPITIIYSTPSERFDVAMQRLAITLGTVMLIGVAITIAVAGRASRIATKPLHATAQVIGTIDESQLSRRIDAGALPSELAPVAIRLNEMLERLERVFVQRRQFMIDAAHELRSPVAALRTTLEVAMQRPNLEPSTLRSLNNCMTSTRMLDRLVVLLTEQMRGEVAVRPDELEMVDVARFTDECLDVIKPMADVKQILLSCDVEAELTLISNRDRLRSILVNLLSNAVEYTPAGGTVTVTWERRSAHLRLTVSDTGIGIAPEHLPHIFQPFYRVDSSRQRDGERHLGLGLYLVQSHVNALGASCSANSSSGNGTIVTVDFSMGSGSRAGERLKEFDENIAQTHANLTKVAYSARR